MELRGGTQPPDHAFRWGKSLAFREALCHPTHVRKQNKTYISKFISVSIFFSATTTIVLILVSPRLKILRVFTHYPSPGGLPRFSTLEDPSRYFISLPPTLEDSIGSSTLEDLLPPFISLLPTPEDPPGSSTLEDLSRSSIFLLPTRSYPHSRL